VGESDQGIGREGRVAINDFLNRMLEAERAGAKVMVLFMDSFDRNSKEWKTLRNVQAREAQSCALIGKLLEKAGVPYSHATGEFYDRALEVQGTHERLDYLVQGLKWAVQKFDEAMPALDAEARAVFEKMRESHLRSIAACEELVRSLTK
jgi:nitronate monooxygenase